MSKSVLRIWAKNERKKLDIEKISLLLMEKLVNTAEYKNSENIMIYYPLSDEVNFLALMEDTTKTFYLPRINGDDIECCAYKSGDELCDSCFHTKEPVCPACDKNKIDMVIVPALCCDKNNYRLGYGGGFYDRFLKDYKGSIICCIPQELLVDTVYPEKYDIKMQRVITSA